MSDFATRLANLEQKVCTIVNLGGVSEMTNVLPSGPILGLHTNGNGIPVNIRSLVSTLIDNGDDSFTYTNQAGTITIIDFAGSGGIYTGGGVLTEPVTEVTAVDSTLCYRFTKSAVNDNTTKTTFTEDEVEIFAEDTDPGVFADSTLTVDPVRVKQTVRGGNNDLLGEALVEPQKVTLQANDLGNARSTFIAMEGTTIDLRFNGASDLKLNGDAGLLNYALLSQGPGTAPIWGAIPIPTTLYSGSDSLAGNTIVTGDGFDMIWNMSTVGGTDSLLEIWDVGAATKGKRISLIDNPFSARYVQTLTNFELELRDFNLNTQHQLILDNGTAGLIGIIGVNTSSIKVDGAVGLDFVQGASKDWRINGVAGVDGQFIRSFGPGNNAAWADLPSYDLSLQLNFSAEVAAFAPGVVGEILPVDTTGGAVSIIPPAAPNAGDKFGVFDSRTNAATNNITVTFTSLPEVIQGQSVNKVLNIDGQTAIFVYSNDPTIGWVQL